MVFEIRKYGFHKDNEAVPADGKLELDRFDQRFVETFYPTVACRYGERVAIFETL